MYGYIAKAIHKFQHTTPKRPQHVLHDWNFPAYGSRAKYAQTEPELMILEPYVTQRVHYIAGTPMYYS